MNQYDCVTVSMLKETNITRIWKEFHSGSNFTGSVQVTYKSHLYEPVSSLYYFSTPCENIRKPLKNLWFSDVLRGYQKRNSSLEWIKNKARKIKKSGRNVSEAVVLKNSKEQIF